MANRCVVCLADFPHEWDICNTFRCCSAKWCNDCEQYIHKCPQCRSENNTAMTYADAMATVRIQFLRRTENSLRETVANQDTTIERMIQSLRSLQTRKIRLKFDGIKLTYA